MTGTDIIEIKRIEKAVKSQKFLQRVFTESERRHINSKKNAAETAAGIFCAKEAVAKALGTGFSEGITFMDIEITYNAKGAPHAALYGRAEEIFKQNNFKDIGISISHCNSYAVAFCVLI